MSDKQLYLIFQSLFPLIKVSKLRCELFVLHFYKKIFILYEYSSNLDENLYESISIPDKQLYLIFQSLFPLIKVSKLRCELFVLHFYKKIFILYEYSSNLDENLYESISIPVKQFYLIFQSLF